MPAPQPSFELSVLDQSPISRGMSTGDALRNSIDLARTADALGYTRYWVAEHHASRMLACASPEALIGPLGAATSGIRIGSGGVMLPHYSPLKVAETFRMLAALYPGRVDLGLGRAPGSDPLTAWALQRDKRQAAPDDFPDQLAELLAYIRDGLPAGHRLARMADLPRPEERPTPWLLGSSPQSGVWAAELGLPYAFADFIAPGGAAIARRYASSFVPSVTLDRPQVIAAVWALCAETDAEAIRLASSSRMAFAHFLSGTLIQVPPVDEAEAFLDANRHLLDTIITRRRAVVGSPTTVRRALESVAVEYGADELMLVTITFDHAARRRSYELLAAEFGLVPRTA
ncbi:MAG: LLM class flavin-dependent oxidoreductase [Vicinamibacterales bacterium]